MILSENALYIKYIRLKEAGDFAARIPYTVPALAGFSGLRFPPPGDVHRGRERHGQIDAAGSHRRKSGIQCRGRGRRTFGSQRARLIPRYTGTSCSDAGCSRATAISCVPRSFYNVATEVDQIADGIHRYYGDKSLHRQSHGESFLSLLEHRLRGNGPLYLRLARGRPLAVAADVYAVPDKNSSWKADRSSSSAPTRLSSWPTRRRHLRDREQRAATHRTGANAALPADDTLLPRPRRYAQAVGVRHPGILKRGRATGRMSRRSATTAQAFRTDAAQDLHGRLARILTYEFDGTDITTGTSAHEKSRLRNAEPGFL